MTITEETRRESNRKTDKTNRRKQILEIFRQYGELTARECLKKLHRRDMNYVRPRITELIKLGKLVTCGKKYDRATDRNVTVFKLMEEK